MNIQIIDADISHFKEIYRMLEEFAGFQKTPGKFKITLQEFEDAADLFNCVIAVKGEEILGMASWFFAFYSWSGKAIYLDDLYVKETYRGKGIGKQMLEDVIQKAKDSGCKKMRWQVSKWNHNAISFYRERGAAIDDVEINCDLADSNF